MITDAEKEQLARIEAQEGDFYAQVLFLVLSRLAPTELFPVEDLRRENIATVIMDAFKDIDTSAMEPS